MLDLKVRVVEESADAKAPEAASQTLLPTDLVLTLSEEGAKDLANKLLEYCRADWLLGKSDD